LLLAVISLRQAFLSILAMVFCSTGFSGIAKSEGARYINPWFQSGNRRCFMTIALLLLVVASVGVATAAERVVLFEEYTQTG